MNRRNIYERGSVTVMVTLALIAMCGILGLAVDLGWSYYTNKSEQAAADTAALAAVAFAKQNVPAPYNTCGTTKTTLYCDSTPKPCSSISTSSNAYSACQYAQQNGFTDGQNNVSVTVAGNITSPAPTVPGVAVTYWFTVRVNQQIPQLFSAVLGNTTGLVSARATAALSQVIFKASLDLLNRQNDPNIVMGTGVDLSMSGGGMIISPGGMLLASNLVGAANFSGVSSNQTADCSKGSGVGCTPFSWFRGTGTCVSSNSSCTSNWNKPWTNGHADGETFWDPTSLFTNPDQPSLSQSSAVNYPIAGGKSGGVFDPTGNSSITGAGTQKSPYILPPGNYYSVDSTTGLPNGMPITFAKAYYQFGAVGQTDFAASNQWVFYGGLSTTTGSVITVVPGRYVFAGTTGGNPDFSFVNGTTIQDTNTGVSGYPGEIFIFTNPSYSADGTSLTVPSAITTAGLNFQYGEAGFKGGNDVSKSIFNLTGLDQSAAPSDLQNWAPFLLWQDRGDSTVAYNSKTGVVYTSGSCPAGSTAETGTGSGLDLACKVTNMASSTAPQMSLQATPSTALTGAVYQPRGAWLTMGGSGKVSGSLQIITGALNDQGGGTVTLTGISNPITILATALIE